MPLRRIRLRANTYSHLQRDPLMHPSAVCHVQVGLAQLLQMVTPPSEIQLAAPSGIQLAASHLVLLSSVVMLPSEAPLDTRI